MLARSHTRTGVRVLVDVHTHWDAYRYVQEKPWAVKALAGKSRSLAGKAMCSAKEGRLTIG